MKLLQLCGIDVRDGPIGHALAFLCQQIIAVKRIVTAHKLTGIGGWPQEDIYHVLIAAVHDCGNAPPTEIVDTASQELKAV
jgi:hypothetical protein